MYYILLKRPFKNGSRKRVDHVKINTNDVNCQEWTLSIVFCRDLCHVVAICLTYLHCLQHSLFEHLFNLYYAQSDLLVRCLTLDRA